MPVPGAGEQVHLVPGTHPGHAAHQHGSGGNIWHKIIKYLKYLDSKTLNSDSGTVLCKFAELVLSKLFPLS